MIKYLSPFLLSFFLTVFSMVLIIWIAKKIKWQSRISVRDIHNPGVSRMGGLIMALVFNATIFLNQDLFMTAELYGFSLGTLILLIIGFWDDVKEIFWKIQLFIQISVAVLVFIMGVKIYYITNPFSGGVINLDSGIGIIFSVFLVIFWIILIVNSINWVDGIDGLSGGITFIAAAAILFLSFRPEVNQPPIAIICLALMGTVLAFLIFNFHPSRILAGTSGAMFMGFSLAVLAIFSGAKIATALLVLAIPVIDFLWVIGERIKKGKSIFLPDKNHLHYKLMELGWSQRKISLSYWAVTLIVAVLALNTRAMGKGVIFLAVATVMIIFLIFINKKIYQIDKKNI